MMKKLKELFLKIGKKIHTVVTDLVVRLKNIITSEE